jgi:hypothetical protein
MVPAARRGLLPRCASRNDGVSSARAFSWCALDTVEVKHGGEVRPRLSVTCVVSRVRSSIKLTARIQCRFQRWNLHLEQLDLGAERCCHVGDALRPFALAWLRTRKPLSVPVSLIAHPVPLFGITSRNIQLLSLRCGRGVTASPRPRSKRRGIVSRAHLLRPRRPLAGRCSNHLRFVGRGVSAEPVRRSCETSTATQRVKAKA